MKKQINPSIKAHFIRGVFYLLLLIAVCAIPFALAQRNVATRSKAKASPSSEFLTTSNAAVAPAIAVSVIPPIPAAPATILYDQTNNPAPTPPPPPSNGVITSQDYEPEFDNYDSFAADDFVIPPFHIWNITEVDVIGESSEPPVPPDSFHVFFYRDSGTLPGTLVASRLANPYSGFGIFVITLTSPVKLGEVPTGCQCRRGKTSLAPVNGSGATGWLYQTLEQPGKTLAAALGRTVLLGAARLPAAQPKTGRTNYSA